MTEMLPPLQPVDMTSAGPVGPYMRAMAAVCPFIEPSARAGLLHACDVAPDCHAAADVHPRLFEQLVPQIERFRDARRAVAAPHQRVLVCHVVVIRLPPALDADAGRLLGWPNLLGWSLKHLYTPKEIVLGFVRKGVAERSTAGVPVPAAPFHAVVIRSRVAGPDRRFYPGNGPMLQAMIGADDDGRDVHHTMFPDPPDVRDPRALRDAKYYDRVTRWWKTNLAKR